MKKIQTLFFIFFCSISVFSQSIEEEVEEKLHKIFGKNISLNMIVHNMNVEQKKDDRESSKTKILSEKYLLLVDFKK
ncbi:MAG: hypothetical protein KJ799_11025 [Bacteroidetes bacterium]|nr:hypothetical protein [Bacteroidota bacterium]MBU1680730.1 hypothetical protein [Bacteroidota bacterium]MBU2507241.1 hypothetical protein [Bacteroidota bacterium]